MGVELRELQGNGAIRVSNEKQMPAGGNNREHKFSDPGKPKVFRGSARDLRKSQVFRVYRILQMRCEEEK